MKKCSVCGKDFAEVDLNLQKMLANLPRYFADLGRPTECKEVVTSDFCSVECLRQKLASLEH